MKKRLVVKLTLEELIRRGREAAFRRRHTEVLLLADRLVEWEMVDSISHEWVHQVQIKPV